MPQAHRIPPRAALIFVLLPLALSGCSGRPKLEPASLVLHKGRIVTVEAAKPEVQALAARADTRGPTLKDASQNSAPSTSSAARSPSDSGSP